MATQVTMKNEATGELKQVKVGWSWILFFFSGFLGIPLFLRKLYVWGGFFLALWIVNFVAPSVVNSVEDALGIQIVLMFVFLGLQIWLGIKGNEMTAKNYLENGYVWQDAESDEVKFAKGKWGLQ
tara:strand:- start:15 stop:389 length:375 start_codon:yes stop_codon:yes gene_type:complete